MKIRLRVRVREGEGEGKGEGKCDGKGEGENYGREKAGEAEQERLASHCPCSFVPVSAPALPPSLSLSVERTPNKICL